MPCSFQLERGQFLFHYWLCFIRKNTYVHGLFQIFIQPPGLPFDGNMLQKEVPTKKYEPSECKILFWDTALVYLKCRRIYYPHSTGEMSPLCLVFSNVSFCSELKILLIFCQEEFSAPERRGSSVRNGAWGAFEDWVRPWEAHCRLQVSVFQLRG